MRERWLFEFGQSYPVNGQTKCDKDAIAHEESGTYVWESVVAEVPRNLRVNGRCIPFFRI